MRFHPSKNTHIKNASRPYNTHIDEWLCVYCVCMDVDPVLRWGNGGPVVCVCVFVCVQYVCVCVFVCLCVRACVCAHA